MKKALLSILTILSLNAFASITVTSSDIKWVVGNTWTMNVTSGESIDNFTKTGTGVSWDFTSYLNSSTIDTVKIVNKTAGANSTIRIESDIITGTNCEPLTENWGMETFEVIGTDVSFLSGSHELGFPHAENDTWNSASTVINISPPYIPHPTSLSGAVIASGQVITNYGTFDAILVQETMSIAAYSLSETYYYWETKEYGRIATLIDGKFSVMKNNNFNPVTIVSTKKINQNNLKIFPNPSIENFTVKADALENVKVFDAIGNLVYEEKALNNSIVVNTSTLNSGIYFVQASANGNTSTSRVVVK